MKKLKGEKFFRILNNEQIYCGDFDICDSCCAQTVHNVVSVFEKPGQKIQGVFILAAMPAAPDIDEDGKYCCEECTI
jgi:hypothetical protein